MRNKSPACWWQTNQKILLFIGSPQNAAKVIFLLQNKSLTGVPTIQLKNLEYGGARCRCAGFSSSPHQKWNGLEKMNSRYWANCKDTKFQLAYLSQYLVSPSVREKKSYFSLPPKSDSCFLHYKLVFPDRAVKWLEFAICSKQNPRIWSLSEGTSPHFTGNMF